MTLTIDGRDKMREARRRAPQVAAQKQSAFARRYYADHPHACRACPGHYTVAWILFYFFHVVVRWADQLHHRTYRHKAGTEPNHVGCPLCNKHAARSDVLRRKWEAGPRGQYGPLVTKHRLWIAWKWVEAIPCYVAGAAGLYLAILFCIAHMTITFH